MGHQAVKLADEAEPVEERPGQAHAVPGIPGDLVTVDADVDFDVHDLRGHRATLCARRPAHIVGDPYPTPQRFGRPQMGVPRVRPRRFAEARRALAPRRAIEPKRELHLHLHGVTAEDLTEIFGHINRDRGWRVPWARPGTVPTGGAHRQKGPGVRGPFAACLGLQQ